MKKITKPAISIVIVTVVVMPLFSLISTIIPLEDSRYQGIGALATVYFGIIGVIIAVFSIPDHKNSEDGSRNRGDKSDENLPPIKSVKNDPYNLRIPRPISSHDYKHNNISRGMYSTRKFYSDEDDAPGWTTVALFVALIIFVLTMTITPGPSLGWPVIAIIIVAFAFMISMTLESIIGPNPLILAFMAMVLLAVLVFSMEPNVSLISRWDSFPQYQSRSTGNN